MTRSAWITEITLSPKQVEFADQQTDQLYSRRRTARTKDLAIEPSKKINTVGGRSEYAAALCLNMEWTGAKPGKQPDLDAIIDVKSTTAPNGLLIDRRHDEWTPYLLVYNKHPLYQLVGWAFGFEILKTRFARNDLRMGRKRKNTSLPTPFIRPANSLYGVKSLVEWHESKLNR